MVGELGMNPQEGEKVKENPLEHPLKLNVGGVTKAWAYPRMTCPIR